MDKCADSAEIFSMRGGRLAWRRARLQSATAPLRPYRRPGGTFGIPHRLVGSNGRGSVSWNTRRAREELK